MPLTLNMIVSLAPLRPVEEFADMLMEIKPNHVAVGVARWRDCQKCGEEQILTGYRREYDFWGSLREYTEENRCRACDIVWETDLTQ